MNKATIYLCLGRAIIFIYLFLVFFIVLAETIVSRNTKAEPSNYEETAQVLNYVVHNIEAPPMTSINITHGNTTIPGKSHVLYEWVVDSDWCWCESGLPFLGPCPPDSNFTLNFSSINSSSTCHQWPKMDIPIDIWKGSAMTVNFAPSDKWSFPIKPNHTCSSSFETYQNNSGVCTLNNLSVIISITSSNETGSSSTNSYSGNENWTLAGNFAGWGISAPPIDEEDEEDEDEEEEETSSSSDEETSADNTTASETSTTVDSTTSENNTSSDNSTTTDSSSLPQQSNVDIPPETTGYSLFYSTNKTASVSTEEDDDSAWTTKTTTKAGSPYINLKISRYGEPCLNPSKNPNYKYEYDYYPLQGNNFQGCGYWNTSSDLYEQIDWIMDWNIFLNNDFAKNKTFFDDLYHFDLSGIDEFSYLIAERKLIVNDTDFCYSWVRNPEVTSDYGSVSLLRDMRNIVIVMGFTVTTLAILSFLIYRITNRCKEVAGGLYLFWLEHGLGTLNAIIALTVGILSKGMISTIDTANAYLYQVAENACITNVPVFNTVYAYMSSQISATYGYVPDFNDFNMYAASAFLLLELILLLSWLICFQCKEELENEESLSDNPNKKQQGIELA